MPAPDPFAGDNARKFDPALHWREDAGNYSPNSTASFSRRSGEFALVGKVDFARATAAMRFFLGYSAITPAVNISPPGGKYQLARTPPAYHPSYPRLVCTGVSAEDFKLNPVITSPATTRKTKVPVFELPALPGGSPPPIPSSYNTIWGSSLQNRTNYLKSKITARFTPVAFPMLGDTEVYPGGVCQEWRRWTIIEQTPRAEMMSLSGFQQVFVEGDANTGAISNPIGKPNQADIGQVLIKSDVRVQWLDVTEDWIFTPGAANLPSPYPRNIMLGLGTVNSTNFLGYLAGTLLLMGVEMIRNPWPLAAGGESRYNYDLTFHFSFFDPPKGFRNNVDPLNQIDPGTGEPVQPRGHNCLPWRGSVIAGDINAGMWFGASFTGDVNDRALFGVSNFGLLFDSARNPYV